MKCTEEEEDKRNAAIGGTLTTTSAIALTFVICSVTQATFPFKSGWCSRLSG